MIELYPETQLLEWLEPRIKDIRETAVYSEQDKDHICYTLTSTLIELNYLSHRLRNVLIPATRGETILGNRVADKFVEKYLSVAQEYASLVRMFIADHKYNIIDNLTDFYGFSHGFISHYKVFRNDDDVFVLVYIDDNGDYMFRRFAWDTLKNGEQELIRVERSLALKYTEIG